MLSCGLMFHPQTFDLGFEVVQPVDHLMLVTEGGQGVPEAVEEVGELSPPSSAPLVLRHEPRSPSAFSPDHLHEPRDPRQSSGAEFGVL